MRLADKVVSVSANYQTTREFCKKYLLEEEPSEVDIEVNIDLTDIEEEKKVAVDANLGAFSDKYLETLALHRKVSEELTKFNTVLFHGSAIAVDGEVYLFTAPSGTGKSTHTNEWKKCFGDKLKIINGDKPIVRFFDKKVYAYGSPWCGEEGWFSNDKTEILSVCFLEQSDTNLIKKLDKKEVLNLLMKQVVLPKNSKRKLIHYDLVDKFIKSVDFYLLQCDISQEAVLCAYNEMSKQG